MKSGREGIVKSAAAGDDVRLSSALVQPIVSDDVAALTADVVLGQPLNGVVEIAGPEKFKMSELVQQYLRLTGDPRTVLADPQVRYFGAILQESTLLPGPGARLGTIGFETYFGNLKFILQRISAIGIPCRRSWSACWARSAWPNTSRTACRPSRWAGASSRVAVR